MKKIFELVASGCSYRKLEKFLGQLSLTVDDIKSIKNDNKQTIAHILCINGNIKLLKYHSRFLFDSIDKFGNLPVYYMLKFIESDMTNVHLLQPLISYGLLNNHVLEHTNFDGEVIKHKLQKIVDASKSFKKVNIKVCENKDTNDNDDSIDFSFYEDNEHSYFKTFDDQETNSTYNYETYEQWCDRIAREFTEKYSYQSRNSKKQRKRKLSPPESTKTSYTTNRLLQSDTEFLYTDYIKRFSEFTKMKHLKPLLFIDDFPWPVTLSKYGFNSENLTQRILKFDDKQLTNLCKSMGEVALFGVLHKTTTTAGSGTANNYLITHNNKKFIKSQQIFWHPDKFQAKYKSRIAPDHVDIVLKLSLNMSQLFNKISNQINI